MLKDSQVRNKIILRDMIKKPRKKVLQRNVHLLKNNIWSLLINLWKNKNKKI